MPANPKESFVPLTQAGAIAHEHADFRITIVRQPANVRPFRPGGSPIAGSSGTAGVAEPQVTLQREGDRIIGIRVQCACGQEIELACVYDVPAGPA